MVHTKYGELPKEAIVGVYMKVHLTEEGDVVVSVPRAFFSLMHSADGLGMYCSEQKGLEMHLSRLDIRNSVRL